MKEKSICFTSENLKPDHTLLITIIATLSFSAYSSENLGALKILFKKNFNTLYAANQCGKNIRNLLALARSQNIDVNQGRIVKVTNRGNTVAHQVPVMKAREAGAIIDDVYFQYFKKTRTGHRQIKNIPKHVRVREAGATRWAYYHDFFLFENHIFDFDFTNQPRVLTKDAYVNDMFLPKDPEVFNRDRSSLPFMMRRLSFEVFSQRVLDRDLKVELIPAGNDEYDAFESMTMREFRES